MRGEHYHVMKEVRIPRGTVLHCSENQSQRHSQGLRAKGPWGWFEVRGEVIFRRGESVFFLETPDIITLQALEPWRVWPEILPSSLSAEPESYYTVGGVTFLPGTVLRLGHEELQRRQTSLKPLTGNWFEAIREVCLKTGTLVQFRESPERYLKDLQRIPVDNQQTASMSFQAKSLPCPEGLSLQQQRAWEALQGSAVLTMKAYQVLCPEVSRRSLQRALEAMVALGLIEAEGKRMKRCYRLVTS